MIFRLLATDLARKLALVLIFTCSVPAFAIDAINSTFFGNLAIEGYDPVAYFTVHKAVKGKSQHELEWMGANWRFSSAKNLGLFRANPTNYAPQYGGYCAYAVSQNNIAGIKPELFTIHENKLYLNYSKPVNRKWLQNKSHFITQANRYWPQLLAK